MGGSRKPRITGRHFRSPTDDAIMSGEFDKKHCDLRLRTHLISVRVQAPEIVKVGTLLPVALIKLNNSPVAVVVDPKTKETVGSLFPPEIDTLIMCLENEISYVAKVLESQGSDILVEISMGSL